MLSFTFSLCLIAISFAVVARVLQPVIQPLLEFYMKERTEQLLIKERIEKDRQRNAKVAQVAETNNPKRSSFLTDDGSALDKK